MSFHEISIAVRGQNLASAEFKTITRDAAEMGASIKDVARDVASLGASAVAVGRLGEMFGILSKEQANVIRTMGSMIALVGTVARGLSMLAASSWAVTIAEKARAIAHAVAWALAGPAGWAVLAGAATAAAVAIGWAASQIREAADAQRDFNRAVSESPGYGRSIRRAGEEEYYRRGVEH